MKSVYLRRHWTSDEIERYEQARAEKEAISKEYALVVKVGEILKKRADKDGYWTIDPTRYGWLVASDGVSILATPGWKGLSTWVVMASVPKDLPEELMPVGFKRQNDVPLTLSDKWDAEEFADVYIRKIIKGYMLSFRGTLPVLPKPSG